MNNHYHLLPVTFHFFTFSLFHLFKNCHLSFVIANCQLSIVNCQLSISNSLLPLPNPHDLVADGKEVEERHQCEKQQAYT